ncbi:hypothetical protein PHOSAC3_150158 [Mesotoga infera]|nr:hypothetical protein PHOSAC3_150158 [Mesotoga infera]
MVKVKKREILNQVQMTVCDVFGKPAGMLKRVHDGILDKEPGT